MFRGKSLAAAGPVDHQVHFRQGRHEEAVLGFLSQQAGVPNYRLRLEPADGGTKPGHAALIDELETAGADCHARTGIARLVAPLEVADFYTAQYRQPGPLVIRGREDRFSDLATWDDLNEIVCGRNLRPPQLHLVRDGQEIASYLYEVDNLGLGTRQPGPGVSRVDGRKLANLLRTGATLIANAIQDHHPPVGKLAREIEGGLGTYVNVNLYASWRPTQGFATHWDDHDVFVLQVTGRKEWHLFSPTRHSPTTHDSEPNIDVPTEPIWVGDLGAGDVLYIPRGWWHDARVHVADKGKGSVHLTLNTRPITGAWVLRWLETKLLDDELFRTNTPLAADADARKDYFARLLGLLRSHLNDDLGDRFTEDLRAAWTEATRTTLATYIEPWKSAAWDDCQLALRGRQQAALDVRRASGVFFLRANGVVHEFELHCLDLVRTLVDRRSISVGELKRALADRFSAEFVDDFLKQLVKDDTVTATIP